jgi:hypothetical protein
LNVNTGLSEKNQYLIAYTKISKLDVEIQKKYSTSALIRLNTHHAGNNNSVTSFRTYASQDCDKYSQRPDYQDTPSVN